MFQKYNFEEKKEANVLNLNILDYKEEMKSKHLSNQAYNRYDSSLN